ncbi:MAG TPA: C25 family cysteine peptidase, partial [Rhodanobacteraceae bacterium]|nr:C25 family cysteine peptidase [Rhodanobacteraceae bacterium]
GQGFSIRNIYTKQDASTAAAANAELKRDLDAGNLLVHFIGHGGAFIWRVGPPADLFTLEDVGRLTNIGRYPMVLAMTCFSAPFDNPTEDSIGESFLREQDKGAVAVFAASWTNSPNPEYSRILIDNLMKLNNPIGDAIVAAKAQIQDRTFVELYNLLGDPALVLARPREKLQLVRGADRWQDQVIVEVPERDFGGDVDIDWVDAAGKTISTQHYESRDARFALEVPRSKPAEVRVYAYNFRTGHAAIGGLQLIAPPEPPAPIVVQPALRAPAAASQPIPAVTGPIPAAGGPKRPDPIARLGFDDAKSVAAPSKPARH